MKAFGEGKGKVEALVEFVEVVVVYMKMEEEEDEGKELEELWWLLFCWRWRRSWWRLRLW